MDDSGITGIGSNNDDNEPITVDEQSPKRSPKRSPKHSPKRRANQSEVWDHFEKLEKVPGEKQKAVCNHCGQIYTCDSNANGTSSMKTHIKLLCRQYELSQFNMKKNPVIEIKEGMLKLFNWYEKKSVEHGKTQNVGEFSRSEKNLKEYVNFCEEMDDEFERHMEEENNMHLLLCCAVRPKNPYGRITMLLDLDYDVDSDEEWEEEEPGESLSDCDKDDEEEKLEEGYSKDELKVKLAVLLN
ncbi:hypothetical protein RHGRI_006831 [Rhododendron griersonianum]|uniref:BED-type domain-containing protein n=1 Tax=Rhododendron griersonianum TaxID=479676 RepID=A0AAV6KWB3_9ERIC|nr:hypothetical protein RHGRI_006831 [Rhododendron griersonianum]